MIKSLALAAALSLAFAGSAFADTSLVAALQSPLAKPVKVIAGGAVWTCAETSCAAASDAAVSVSACHALGKQVGPVASYGPEGQAFGAAEVAKCNAGLKPAAVAATAPQTTTTTASR